MRTQFQNEKSYWDFVSLLVSALECDADLKSLYFGIRDSDPHSSDKHWPLSITDVSEATVHLNRYIYEQKKGIRNYGNKRVAPAMTKYNTEIGRYEYEEGKTLLEEYAGIAMAGLLSSCTEARRGVEETARVSVKYAKELIKQLYKEQSQ